MGKEVGSIEQMQNFSTVFAKLSQLHKKDTGTWDINTTIGHWGQSLFSCLTMKAI